MPNFKQLLDALFKTRTTPAEAAAASAINPAAEYLIAASTAIAPCNGWCVASVTSTDERSATYGYIGNKKLVGFRALIGNGQHYSVEAPVKKGESVVFDFENATMQSMSFFEKLGGGYRLLLKALQSGGAPCLRLKNCSTLWRRESVLRNRKEPSSILFRSRADLLMSHTLPHSTATHAFAHGRAIAAQLATKLSPSKTQSISAVELCGGRKCSATCGLSSHAEKVTQFSLEWAFQKVETFKEELSSTLVSALPNLCANCEEVRYVA